MTFVGVTGDPNSLEQSGHIVAELKPILTGVEAVPSILKIANPHRSVIRPPSACSSLQITLLFAGGCCFLRSGFRPSLDAFLKLHSAWLSQILNVILCIG